MVTVALVVIAIALAGVGFFGLYRPWQLRWGATREEVDRTMPGDEVVPGPTFNATRAVAIDATPEAIWPWIVQIGFGRAGWYSYDFLDNLGRHSAEHIVPDLQHMDVGDLVPLGPGKNSGMRVKDFETGRYMVWWDSKLHLTTWTWLLDPLATGGTRLVTRVRARSSWRHPSTVMWMPLLEIADFPMMRKCLLGIKRRAEALVPRGGPSTHEKVGDSHFQMERRGPELQPDRGWGPSPRIRLVGELTAERLANEAGVEATLVRRLAALGILKPERPDRYVAGDVVRVETVNAFLNAGITLDEIAAAVATGTFTFDYIDLFYTPPSERSARTYEAFARSLGSRAGLLPALYAAMGLPEPNPESHLRTDEEGLIQKFLEAWKQAGDEETYSRAARMAGEGARTVSEGWVDLFVEKISGPLEAAGIDRRKAIDVIIRTGPRVARLAPELLLWLQQRHLRHAIDAANIEALEAALAEQGFSAPRPERLPAMAFVDLSGYTKLTEELGDEVAVGFTALLRERSEEVARRHQGSLVKLLGDGAMLHFRDASGGVTGALELVAALGQASLPAHAGLHAGPVIERDGDYFGRTVNLASRVSGRAGPGEVLVTEAVASAAGGNGISFEPAGEQVLEGVREPVRLFRARS